MPERAGAACVVAKPSGDKSVLVEICQQLLPCPFFFFFEYHELALHGRSTSAVAEVATKSIKAQ
jgi:hypothetical protein